MANFLTRIGLWLLVLGFPMGDLSAHEAHEPHAAWYKQQTINPAAKQRMGIAYNSCCDYGDVYKTRFRKNGRWEYLDGDVWKVIPEDIIKDAPTPDSEPTLFRNRHDGKELCFFLGQGGL